MLRIIHCSSTGDYLPALPVGRAPPGSSGCRTAVVGDRPVVPGGHGGPHVPHACANHVWKAVFEVQVTHTYTHSQNEILTEAGKEGPSPLVTVAMVWNSTQAVYSDN